MPNPGQSHAAAAAQRDALIEDIEFLVKVGTPSIDIPHRVGFRSMDSLKRQLHRMGRYDLVSSVANSEPFRVGCHFGRTAYSSRMSA